MATVSIVHFSDLLCVWAYVGQIRVDELRRSFGDELSIDSRFVSVFGSTAARLERWSDRGGAAGYARHVREVVDGFDHTELHPDVWTRVIPAGSWLPHAFARAAGQVDASSLEKLAWEIRLAFFRDGRDVGRLEVLLEVAQSCGLSGEAVRRRFEEGHGLAGLSEDHELARRHQVTGSPTFVLNEGRQTLYGNVGYRVIQANVQELLRDNSDHASWC